jgi:hypothetical protein
MVDDPSGEELGSKAIWDKFPECLFQLLRRVQLRLYETTGAELQVSLIRRFGSVKKRAPKRVPLRFPCISFSGGV